MSTLSPHEYHRGLGARFIEVGGAEAAEHYGDWLTEHAALRNTAGVLDLSFRSRLWVRGSHRQKFLNGQVTNQVAGLHAGEGCYAALTDPKGRMVSDLSIYCLPDSLLLDFEPGFGATVGERLQRYVLGSDVQLADAAQDIGLLSLQGPKSVEVARVVMRMAELPARPMSLTSCTDPELGTFHVASTPRVGTSGFDLFVPQVALRPIADRLIQAARTVGGGPCGWQALETARIEAGLPRFGADMDETNLPPEAGLEDRAISYTKGCYVGQEVIARLQSRGQVARALRGLRLAEDLPALPVKGDKLFKESREVGHITSAARSPAWHANLALGYVRREVNQAGTDLVLRMAAGESPARIVEPPHWD